MTLNEVAWMIVGIQYTALFAVAGFVLYFKSALRRLIADREAADLALARMQQKGLGENHG